MFQIGTNPRQDVRLFPTIIRSQMYLVDVDGGCNFTSQLLPNGKSCADSRGGTYNKTASRSFGSFTSTNMSAPVFNDFGFYNFHADVGFDDIAFGYQTVDGRASSSAQAVVGVIKSWDYSWLGMVGIGNYTVYFSTVKEKNEQKSLLAHLFEAGTIPSRSWAYFAGSKYCECWDHPTIRILTQTIRR